MRIIYFFILFFISKNVFAGGFINFGAMYLKQHDKSFEIKNKLVPTASIGYFIKLNNISVSAQTNRIFNLVNKEFVRNKKNNQIYELKSRTTVDSLATGYFFKNINPAIFISNVRLEQTINQRQIKHSFIFGLNINYFFAKNISVASAIVAPNKKLGLTTAGLLTFNYFF